MTRIKELRRKLEVLEEADEALREVHKDGHPSKSFEGVRVWGDEWLRLPPDHEAAEMEIRWPEMRSLLKAFARELRCELEGLEKAEAA